jgi:hypothetical protein
MFTTTGKAFVSKDLRFCTPLTGGAEVLTVAGAIRLIDEVLTVEDGAKDKVIDSPTACRA